MGIKDLFNTIGYSLSPGQITAFKGKKLAVDASGWLHKAIFACAEDSIDNDVDSQLYVDFILGRAVTMQQVGVEPVMVFDGKRHRLKV